MNDFYLFLTLVHLLFWMLIYGITRKRVDVFDPFYITTALYILIFVLAPYLWLLDGQTAYQGHEIMQYLPIATLVFNIGYIAFAFGSITKKRFVIGKIGLHAESADYNEEFENFLFQPENRQYIVKYAWIVFVVSMALALFYYRMTGKSLLYMLTLGQATTRTSTVSGFGFYFLMEFIRSAIPGIILLIAFSSRKKLLIYVLAIALSMICTTTGSRNLAICVVLSIIVYHYLKNNKRPSIVMLFAMVIVMYLFVGIIGTFRLEIRSGAEIQLDTLSSKSMFRHLMYNLEIFYPFYTLVGMVTNGTISIHYGLGILNIIVQFIPRAIWPSKPANLGVAAMEAMYGNDLVGSAFPNIGEFYYELGFPGMIILMFLTGYFGTKIYEKCQSSQNTFRIIKYSIFFGYLMQFINRGHFPSWAYDIVFLICPILLIEKIMKRKFIRSKMIE